MQVISQLIKSVNNTELGKESTKQWYILVPQELDISDIFDAKGTKTFTYRQNPSCQYEFRFTQAREKRIVGMQDFYRDYSIEAGDEVILEHAIDHRLNERFFVDFRKKLHSIVLQKFKEGFKILTPSKQNLIDEQTKTRDGKTIELSFLRSQRKKRISPRETDCYAIKIDGVSMVNNIYKRDQLIEIEIYDHVATIKKITTWKMTTFRVQGE